MLLDEDPATLIHECTSNFHTLSDRDALARITSTLSTLSSSRTSRLTTTQTQLRHQTRRLQNLQQQHAMNLQAHNPSAHAEEILRLDGEKFRIAKEANDAEIESERLEGDVRRAEGVLRAFESGREIEMVGSADANVEKDVLKLKLYRSLGIDVEPDTDGRFTKAIVKDEKEVSPHVVEIDPQFSRAYYANRFWGAM